MSAGHSQSGFVLTDFSLLVLLTLSATPVAP